MSMLTDEKLLADVTAGMSGRAIAKKYGMTPGSINRRIKRLGARGLGHGGNVSRFVPDGYKVKGTSSLVKPDGSVALQWVKTDVDADNLIYLSLSIAAELADLGEDGKLIAELVRLRMFEICFMVQTLH